MRYYVIGSDGQRYGPVDVTQLQQWVNEGRVTRTTMVVEESSGQQYAANIIAGLIFPMTQGGPQQSQQDPSQYYARPGFGQQPLYAGPVPNTGLSIGLAIFSMLCCGCMPLGIVALIYAIQANSAASRGDIGEANRLDGTSRTWSYWSIGVGILCTGLYFAAGVLGQLGG